MRDPTHPAWPDGGERTELREIAERWKWAYVDLAHGRHKARVLHLPPDRTLQATVDAYKAHVGQHRAQRTLAGVTTATQHLLDRHEPHTSIYEVRVQPMVDELLAQGYQASTLKTYMASLQGMWSWAKVPWPGAEIGGRAERRVRVWSDGEIKRIRDAARRLGPRQLLLVDLGLYAGLRRGEMLGVRWDDFRDGSVSVVRQRPPTGTTMKPPKGKRGRVAVLLPGWNHEPGDGYLLPINYATAKRWTDAILEAAGLNAKGVGTHSFRHAYARIFLERVPDILLLQASLGHASVTTTERLYHWLLPDKAAEIARERLRNG